MTTVDDAARLDEYLDALARGDPPRATTVPNSTLATIRHLDEHWHRLPPPDAGFAGALWGDLMASERTLPQRSAPERPAAVSAPSAARPRPGTPHRPRPERTWRPVAALTTAAMLALAVLGSFVAFRPAASPTGREGPAVELYAVESSDDASVRLVPLDAATLADRGDGGRFEDAGDAALAFSADGSTLVGVQYRPDPGRVVNYGEDGPDDAVTVSVRDGRTGAETIRFPSPAWITDPRLSRDGGRLVVEAVDTEVEPRPIPPGWYVYDTGDGRLLATVENRRSVWASLVDPEARRLYHLTRSLSSSVPGRRAAEVIAYDLGTGQEIGRLELPEVRIGPWETSDGADRGPGAEELTPGGAISPDGRTLAIVHADAEAVTVIDTERLVVERTVALTRPRGWRDRLAARLPLAPRVAAAKQANGPGRAAVFAPDGRHLYVHGWNNQVRFVREPGDYRGIGLQLVDLERGIIVAEAFPDATLDAVLPTPDGREVYVFETDVGGQGKPYVLRRLDARSLTVLAERRYGDWPRFMLVPVAPRH